MRRSLWTALAFATVAALVGGSLLATGSPGLAAPQQHSQSFAYTGSTAVWTVPAGVRSVQVEIRGGQGGNGGDDAAGAPATSTYRGVITGTLEVAPGQALTVAVGGGGVTGRSSAQGTAAGPAGGNNPLSGYDGGTGGRVGTAGSSGQGGGGGAASVLRIDGEDIVAGGGGGNGGSGQYGPTMGRVADSVFVPRADATSTDGQVGMQPTGGNNDGGGSGGGGGGAQGGAQGRVEFGAGTSTEWFGYGGSVGQNSTASFTTLSEGYEHVAQNAGHGSIVIRWVTGVAAAPAAPQGVAGIGEVDLYWNAPTEIGQGPITDYRVQYSADGGTSWNDAPSVGSAATEQTVTGLSNGTAYVFRIAAVTPAGIGDYSPQSQPLTPFALPSAPTITDIASLDGALSVGFTAPATGAPPTGYQYRVDGGAWVPVAGTGQPIAIPGLSNGTPYSIEIRATSSVGAGAASTPESGTPRAVPGAPTVTGVAAGVGTGTVSFAAGFDGGSPITGYEYRLDDGSWQTIASGASPLVLSGLGDGTSTQVEIRAVNAVGAGAPSAPVTVKTPGAPGSLVDASAVGLDRAMSVDFSLGTTGGSPITSVEVSLDGGTSWAPVGLSGPIVIPDLVNGSEQSVQLRAVNAVGAGPASTVTAIPATVPGAPDIAEVEDNDAGGLDVTFTAPAQDGGSAITGYEYSTDGGLSWASAGAVADATSLTITRGSAGETLDPETVYPISLRAVNSAGAGPASSALNTLGPVQPVLAGAPTITAVSSQPGALAVAFTPGDNGGATVTEYQYSIDGGSNWTSTRSLSGSFVIGGLVDGTSYPVLVRAVTSVGDGASSAPISGTPASAPEAPTLTALQRGDGQLTVEATMGGSGGSPVTDLEYTLDAGVTWHSAGRTEGPVTITGLNNGESVTVQLRARNAVGVSGASNPLSASPAGVPPQPVLELTPGNTTVAVAISFPSDGGAPLTGIEYSLDGGDTWLEKGSLSGPLLLTGRTNGTPVEVRVRGMNAIGAGAVAVETATPRTVPGPPTDVTTVGNTSSVEVGWQAPADDGGSPITGYTAHAYTSTTSTTPVASCTSTDTEACTIPGLANGTTYFVAVAAQNAAGTGPESVRRPSAMPLLRPGAPNLTAVTAGDQRLTLTFAAGTAGDRPIQRYEYTVDGGTTWLPLGTGSPANVSGLTNGTLYHAQVRAVSDAGPGLASNVRSGTPYGYPFAPTNIVATPASGSASVSWSPADLNGTALLRYAVTLFNAQSGGAVAAGPLYTTGTSLNFTGLANGTTYYASIQTEATAPVGGTLYSERSDPRVPVTPNQAGTPPTFGSPTRTVDGYTVTITNYQASSTYTLDQTGLPAGASATRSGDTITVTGMAPGVGGTVGVTVTRSGFTPATAAVMGTALNAGVAPEFGTPASTVDGYTVQITNFDAAASYSTFGLAPGVAAVVDASGLVTVTGVDPGASESVSVRVAKTDSADAVGSTQGSALGAALQPSFGTPTRTADGFTVQIENYDAAFSWSAAPTAGSATVDSSGLMTVTGLVPGGGASVAVGTTRIGFADGAQTVSGSALEAALVPVFGTPTRTADGFTVQIENYDAAFAWSADSVDGAATVSASGLVTVTGLDAGAAATVTVETSRSGFVPGSSSASSEALSAGAAPVFGTPTRTVDGFTVQIENFDADAEYEFSAPAGLTATVDGSGLVTVTGAEPGAEVELDATVSKAGFTDASASVTGAALETGVAPTFGTPVRTADGYTVAISNYQPLALYVLDPAALPTGASATLSGGTITVTGLAPGTAGEVDVTVTRPGFMPASGGVTGAALETGAAPAFGTPLRTADGYTVRIENFDADASYTLDESELPAGASAARTGDTITVTGLAPGESGEVAVTVAKSGSTDASESVTGTALETGVAPVFGTPARTADGYTVLIENFDEDAEYELSVPAGLTATVDGAGLVTVAGAEPGAEVTLEATASKAGFTDATASVTGAALETGVAPTFGTPTRTADGYTVTISNLDPDAAYELDQSTLPTGATATRSGDTITVTGLDSGAAASVGVTASRADRTDASAVASGAALEAALTPEFGAVTRTADGYTVQITNHDAAFDWSIAVSHGDVAIDASGLVTVTGLEAGAAATVTAETSRSGYVSGSREASGAALETGVAPVFGTPVRTADGYTVLIDNFDADADYELDQSALPAGATASRAGQTITVAGLLPGASGELGVGVSKAGFTEAAAAVTGDALETGIAPAFGPVTRTAQGFIVEITNLDHEAEYLLAAPPGATVRLVGSTLIVTGLAPQQSATIDVRVQLPGSTEAAGSVTGAAQQAGAAPKLSKPKPTADGFEVTILDYDPSLEYTVTVTHGTVTRVGALIVVTGLEPGQEAVLTVTASNADTAANTQAVAGAAMVAPDPGGNPEPPATPTPTSPPGGGLSATGAASVAPIGVLAALLLLVGAGLLGRRRRV